MINTSFIILVVIVILHTLSNICDFDRFMIEIYVDVGLHLCTQYLMLQTNFKQLPMIVNILKGWRENRAQAIIVPRPEREGGCRTTLRPSVRPETYGPFRLRFHWCGLRAAAARPARPPSGCTVSIDAVCCVFHTGQWRHHNYDWNLNWSLVGCVNHYYVAIRLFQYFQWDKFTYKCQSISTTIITYVRHFHCFRFVNVDCFRVIVLAGTPLLKMSSIEKHLLFLNRIKQRQQLNLLRCLICENTKTSLLDSLYY